MPRALQVASSTLENALAHAQGTGQQGQQNRARGLENARAAIQAALARGNGNGNAFGRGRSADVHAILLGGESPSELTGHSRAVRDLVHAYNELRKQLRDAD